MQLRGAESLAWYLRRAAVMSPDEMSHRLVEQFRRSWSRFDKRGWERFDLGDGPLKPLLILKRFEDKPWPAGLEEAAFPDAPDKSLKFLGQLWPVDSDKLKGFWHRDPVTGTSWPADAFCFDVKWRQVADKSYVKFVLELNRLQHLHAAASRAIRDRDERMARTTADVLLHWMDANPPFRGVNWLSGIELALRLVSAAFVVTALDSTRSDHDYRRALRSFVAAHAYWLDRFPSLHSSANNHLVAEGLGLVIASELMPDLSQRYGRKGRAILSEALRTQFHEDGTGIEQSPSYTAFTLEMLLLGMSIDRQPGREIPTEHAERIAKAARYLQTLLDTAGNHPRIGDDDEGRVIVTTPEHEDRYVASVLASAAGTLNNPGLAPPAHAVELRDLVFGALSSNSRRTPSGVFSFPSGGHSVIRENIGGRHVLLVMDHGPLGFSPLAAHGHADALAIWLHVDDQPVFVDAGTYRYNASGGWREWMRSTPAHNTLSINEESQSLTAGDFNWKHKARAKLVSVDRGIQWSVCAQVGGYLKRFGVIHQRFCRRVEGGFLIEDTLSPSRLDLELSIGFLIHPTLKVAPCDSGAVIMKGGHALVKVTSSAQMPSVQVSVGNADNRQAYSPAYNSLILATRIVFRPYRLDEPHRVMVEILPPTVCDGALDNRS